MPRSDADMVALWCESYSTVISDLENCIDLNFDLCVSFCKSDVFLMKHHHVIPTSMFWPLNGRDMRAYINQTLDAFSKEARENALDRLRKDQIYGFQ